MDCYLACVNWCRRLFLRVPTLELGDFDGAPSLGGADERAEHQLQNGSLAESVGDDLEAAALLDKQTLK